MELSGRPLLGTALDKQLFVGRGDVVDKLVRTISLGLNVLVVGPRGSGKSSLLHLVEAHWRESGQRTVFLNGRQFDGAADVLDAIRMRLGLALAEPLSEDTVARFERLIRTLTAATTDDTRRVRVFFDGAASPGVAHELFGRHRDELWQLPLRWVAAADETDMAVYTQPPADAFWDVTLAVPPLGVEEAVELLKRRTDDQFDFWTMADIVDAAKGSPRQLVQLASLALRDQEFPSTWRAAQADQAARLGALHPSARMLLAELEGRGPSSASDPELQRALGWSRPRLTQVLRQLEAAGLVRAGDVPVDGGGKPRRVYTPLPLDELR